MRCTTEEKRHLKRRATADKISVSELLRGALGQIKTPRRRATPQADPQLVTALSRIGTNLNQIARAVNAAQVAGDMRQLDSLQLLAELVGIERQMSSLLASHRQRDTDHVD
jgi:ABC-type Fe3+-citrate transport system substrate-binding protein